MSAISSRLATKWRIFSAAPHRMFFFTGIWQLVAISCWWMFALLARSSGASLEPVLPAVFLHGGAALFLVFTPFMAGFLFTVFPRWQPAPDIPRSVHLAVFAAFNVGQLAFLAGIHGHLLLLVAGLVVLALGWVALLGGLFVSLAQAKARVPHAYGVLTGLLGGFAGLLLFLHATAANTWGNWPLIRGLGIWAFLLPVYFSVCHRMVPFFTSRIVPGYTVFRPDALLYLAVALAVGRALLELAPEWRWITSTPLALVLASLAWKWWPRVPYDAALLRVLHLSLLWLVAGVTLFAAQDAWVAIEGNDPLLRAPLHALGVGFFGGMLVSMVTRVSLGHSGRPLRLDRFTWLVFWLVQATVLVRTVGEFLPGHAISMALAAVLWFAAFIAWGWKFARIYWQPRVDGAAG